MLPPGTTDCHVHVIGDGITHPYRAGTAYRPSPASLEDLQAFHRRWGIDRAVLVQISVHGTDNGLLIECLQRDPGRLRGVAVTTPDPGDRLLARLKESGVVGLRLNLVNGGGPDLAGLARYGALCRDAGLHLQLYLDGLQLPDLAGPLRSLGVPLVFDHFGGIPARVGCGHRR